MACLGIRPDRQLVVAGGWDGRVRVFSNTARLRPLAVLLFHSATVEALAFSRQPVAAGRLAGRNILAAGGKDGKISLWDIY